MVGPIVERRRRPAQRARRRANGQSSEVFETNTFGAIAMIQAALPGFRARAGVIVNVTSAVTLRPRHLLSAYTARKAAVNALTESLALKLEPSAFAFGWSFQDVRLKQRLAGTLALA